MLFTLRNREELQAALAGYNAGFEAGETAGREAAKLAFRRALEEI